MLLTELEKFLEEDLGPLDFEITPDLSAKAVVIAREKCVLAGIQESAQIFNYFSLEASTGYKDGDEVKKDEIVFSIAGNAKNILRAERLALNFLGRMSGIATLTRECVRKAGNIRIACTRKTTPGFRKYEKKAVVVGGGDSHRLNLSDMVIVKDNHIRLMGLEKAILAAKKKSFTKKIEVEVETLEDALKAAEMGVDIIMFDNMEPGEIKRGIQALREKGHRIITEASGGITLENIAEYARTGVDVISMGFLTRSGQWIDFSLEFI